MGHLPTETVEFVRGVLDGTVSDDDYLTELRTGTVLDPLRDWADAPEYTRGDALLFLLESDLATPHGRLDTIGLLRQVLVSQGQDAGAEAERVATADLDLMLSAQPGWVDVPSGIAAEMLAATEGFADRERLDALRAAVLDRFRFVTAPPVWLQAPAWPVVDGRPGLFLGQLDLTSIRHDSAALYVFIDEPTGQVTTVEQVT